MMKQEFEQMVGKEVTYETFEMYEKMYMALPESVNKQQFVEMLNIKAIPEDPAATARREENERRKAAIKKEIVDLNREYIELSAKREMWATKADDFEKREYEWYGEKMRRVRTRIKELKLMLQ